MDRPVCHKLSLKAFAICNKAGVNLLKTSCFQDHSSQKEIRKDSRARWQDQAWHHEYGTMKGKWLCLHFDGKQVKQIEEDWSRLSLRKGLLSVSNFLTGGKQMTFYLELFRQCLQKAQADVMLNLREYYDSVDQIFAMCCDTTSSNTGVFSGAVVLLCTILNTPLLWFLCRRQMGGRTHLSLYWVLHWREDQGHQRGLCVKLQKVWPTVKNEIDEMEELV